MMVLMIRVFLLRGLQSLSLTDDSTGIVFDDAAEGRTTLLRLKVRLVRRRACPNVRFTEPRQTKRVCTDRRFVR